jgi:hypothetical protein
VSACTQQFSKQCYRQLILGVCPLSACFHPQSYVEQHQEATSRLSDLDKQFEAAVASILGITADQQPQLLAEALQEQQQLQEVQVGTTAAAAPCT